MRCLENGRSKTMRNALHTGFAYAIGGVVVWAIILAAARIIGGAHFTGILDLCAVFLLGMLSMYIAQHVYPRF
jgi:hypothetical protein